MNALHKKNQTKENTLQTQATSRNNDALHMSNTHLLPKYMESHRVTEGVILQNIIKYFLTIKRSKSYLFL